MPKVFISYRRDDSAAVAGRLYDRLASHFGPGSVFIDVDSIPYGVDFRSHLAAEVGKCDVLLAVIAGEWLKAEQDGKRRLDGQTDFVRVEIESALARGIPVVPVLIGNVTMPRDEDLPESLRGLAFRNAAPLDPGRDFHLHVERLIRNLDSLSAPASTARPVVPRTPHPQRHGARVIVAGLILAALVAAGVLAYVMQKPKQPNPTPPGPATLPSADLDPDLVRTDPDRAVALWAFGLKANRLVTDEGKAGHWGEDILSADKLPREKFKLLALDFHGLAIGDAEFKVLGSVKLSRLASVDLGETLVTDDGLQHLLPFDLNNLTLMDLVRITDAGAKTIGQMRYLTYVDLSGTGLTDEGLKSLEGVPRLGEVDLKRVKGITLAGVKRFKQAKPGCKVEDDFSRKD